jgi:hypothetical protein
MQGRKMPQAASITEMPGRVAREKPMRKTLAAALLLTVPLCGTCFAKEPSKDEMEKITAALKSIDCQGGEATLRKGGGYSLDDVACKDGQYDMVLDKDFKVVRKKKE